MSGRQTVSTGGTYEALTVAGPYIDRRTPREPIAVLLRRGDRVEVHRWRYGDEAKAQGFADDARKGA